MNALIPHKQVTRPLRHKVLSPLIILGLLFSLVTTWFVHSRFQQQLIAKLAFRGELIANTVNYAAEGLSRSGELQRIVTALGAEHEVESILVVSGSPGNIIASTQSVFLGKPLAELHDTQIETAIQNALLTHRKFQDFDASKGNYHIALPLLMSQSALTEKALVTSVVYVKLDSKPTQESIKQTVIEFTSGFLGILLLLIGCCYGLLRQNVIRPIATIARFIADPSKGAIAEQTDLDTADEIGVLARTLEETLSLISKTNLTLEAKQLALIESEARFREMANSAPVLIWLSGLDRQCFWFNQVWLDFTGRSMEQEIGNGWVENVHPEDLQRYLETYNSHFDRRQEFCMDYRLQRHDGAYRWIQDHGVPRFDANHHFLGYIGSCIDITEKIQTEEQLRESEAFAKATLDAVSSHLCVLDKTGKILAVNKAWRDFNDINALSEDHHNYYLNINYLDVCDSCTTEFSKEAKLVSDGIRKVMRGELEEFSLEYPCDNTKEQLWFLVKVRKFSGESENLVISHENITSSKKANTERSLLLSIIMEAPDFIACADLENRLSFINPAGAKLIGLPAGFDLTQLKISDLHPEWATKRVLEEAIPTVLGQGYWQGETALWNMRDNTEIPVSQLLLLHRDEAGVPRQFSTIMRDISSFKQAEQALKIAKESAESLAHSKSEFLANMSHEIRTPMTAIIGMSHLALNQSVSDEVRDYLEKINLSSESLLGILNDILDLSKLEAGKLQIDNQRFNLDVVLDNLNNLFSIRAQEKHIEFTIEAQKDLPTDLIGDPLRLQQILSNLLGNALKFTERGRVVMQIKLLEAVNSHVRLHFCVSDTGIGISQEDQKKLFEPFSQVDSSVTRRFGGTGLGLVISHNLLNLMGGHFAVESTLGVGTSFSFDLLFSVASHASHQEVNPQLNKRQAGSLTLKLQERGKSLSDAKILVVEDNRINQHLVKEFLKLSGMQVDIASNGKEALSLLDKSVYSAVLMDVHMPEMGGVQATEQIRKQPKFKSLPIIALTAGVTKEERENYLACGMNDIIAKPINPEALIKVLTQWIKPEEGLDTPEQAVDNWAKIEAALPDFDLSTLNTMIAGNSELLLSMLKDFVSDFALESSVIVDYLNKHQIDIAQKHLHRLKGTVGSLGAYKLHHASEILDLQLKQGSFDLESLNAWLITFDQTLAALLPIISASKESH